MTGRTGAMPLARLAKPGTAAALACLVLLVLAGLRGINLHFIHSLTSLDGAMQTLFALDAFANGRQLGEEFQSYLGVTLILFLLPGYLIAGSTLFAASLSATAGVLLGLAATVQTDTAFCQARPVGAHAELVVGATTAGLVAIDIALADVSRKGSGSILTAVEDSPLTRVPEATWSTGPRYGLRLGSDIAAVVPVEAEMPSTVRLEVLDGTPLRVATCSARFIARPDLTGLPSFHAFAGNFPDRGP